MDTTDSSTIPVSNIPPEPETPEETAPAPAPAPTLTPREEVERFLATIPTMKVSIYTNSLVERAIEAIENESLSDKERAEQLAPLQSSILSSAEVFLQELHMQYGGNLDGAPAVFRNMNFDASGKAKESEYNTSVKSYFTIMDNEAVWPHQLVLPADVKAALQLRSTGGNGFYENKEEARATTLANADEVVLSNQPLIRR